ncbi:hypothetical protein MFUM_300002 [Methylacidiphilum fumariolicum SolV]|uniref:Uncharacterized protein n=1 Tax=Methylacidiphilum fumariolicum (strain SolV) TaxID=1156937 RepID=I0JXT2_METFB|nr:hypothetical protein MFUM_300002 [Methylacidiphilum fumariolicum SolV]
MKKGHFIYPRFVDALSLFFSTSVEEALLMKPYYYYNVFFEIQTKLGFVFFAFTI